MNLSKIVVENIFFHEVCWKLISKRPIFSLELPYVKYHTLELSFSYRFVNFAMTYWTGEEEKWGEENWVLYVVNIN